MSSRNLVYVVLLAVFATVLSGCHARFRAHARVAPPPPVQVRATVQAPPPPSANVTVQVSQPELHAGVTVIEASCVQGSQEQCNGLDDNCNGQIDEGCGYQSGNIQITLAWDGPADLDMYVTDPAGETISYQHARSASGGHLDHDARGQCRANQANNNIENVYWGVPNPASGTYQVALHFWGDCNSGVSSADATISISVGGRVIGAYRYTIGAGQRDTVATFTIP